MAGVGVIGWDRIRREAGMVARADTHTHEILRSRLVFLFLATLVLDVIGTLAMYMLEHDDRRSGFTTLGGAFFWVSAQLTTVSSQMPNPVTGAGKALDILFEVWAISVVAALAASLASFFTIRHHERAKQQIDGGHERESARSGGTSEGDSRS